MRRPLLKSLVLLMAVVVLSMDCEAVGSYVSKEVMIEECSDVVWARVMEQHWESLDYPGHYHKMVHLQVIERFKGDPQITELTLAIPTTYDVPEFVTGSEVLIFTKLLPIGYYMASINYKHEIIEGKIPDFDMTIEEFREWSKNMLESGSE